MTRQLITNRPFPGAAGLLLRSLSVTDLRAGSWELRGSVNALWILYRNDRDGAEIRCAGQITPLLGGRLLLIPPGCRFDTSLQADVRHLFGYFELPGMPQLRFRGLERPWLAPASAGDAVLGVLADRACLESGLRDTLALIHLLTGAIAGMAPVALDLVVDEDRLAPALRRIERDFTGPLANADLARACAMTESMFIRRFKAATGTTPAQAVMTRRVQAAAQRLLDGDETLEEVARACGLSTRPYLTRVFTAVLGLSPGEYRRAHGRRNPA